MGRAIDNQERTRNPRRRRGVALDFGQLLLRSAGLLRLRKRSRRTTPGEEAACCFARYPVRTTTLVDVAARAMGRRGQTGSGGAVVSSLSGNSGGTVKKKKGASAGAGGSSGAGGVEIVFENAPPRRKPRHGAASGSGDVSLDAEVAAELATAPKSAGWIGKTPLIFLKEWCTKNDRKRPLYATPRHSALPRLFAVERTLWSTDF